MIFKVFRSFLQLCIFALILQNGKSTHFRGGIISWKPISSSRLEIEFNFRLAFRRSSGSHQCDNNIIARRSIIGAGGVWRTRCLPSCGQQKAADTGFYCTSFSTQEDWSQGENYFNYTFPRAGLWEVSYSSCCWISTLVHGADGGWTLSTTVNLTTRSDTGTINSSPVSASSPIVRLQSGCPQTIKIPTEDADGDLVRCRWAVGSTECSGVCNAFPWGILDEEKCTIIYNGNGRRGWYAVAITLEDFPPTTTNFRNASGFSKVGLQFLVHIAQYSGVCNRKPFMTGSSPSDGACLEIPTNRVSRFTLEAKHMDSSKSVVEILTVSPLGLVMTPLRSYTDSFGDRVYYKNVSWTPSSNQVGQHIFCFKALDKTGFESQQRCVTFLVGSGNTPIPILSSRFPVSNPVVHWSRSVVWRISFNSLIKRPKHSKFIKLFLLGHEIYRLDTRTSRDVSIVGNSSTLQFVTPSVVLSMRGNYSLIIDPGAVVGQGCSSDGPATPGLTALDDWTFFAGACAKGLYLGGRYHSCVDVDECATVSPLKVNARQRRSSLINKGTRERHRRWSEPAECTNYTRISSVDRAVDYYIANSSRRFCDNNLTDGWYRFTGNAGTQMLETCVTRGKCGTIFPGWLIGPHPTVQEGLVNRTVCFGSRPWWMVNSCCILRQIILVRNCSGFYVYRLTNTNAGTPFCSRYCGDNRNGGGITPQPPTAPPVQVSCNFDKDDCGFTQLTNDKFDWTRRSVSTSSSRTGPSNGHGGKGYYMYIETSYPRKLGDNAKIEKAGLKFTGNTCIRFFYHMYGATIGTLNVLVDGRNVFKISGNKGNAWKEANVKTSLVGVYSLTFEGIRGSGFTGDIAIDDIKVYECSRGDCSAAPLDISAISPGIITTPNYPSDYGNNANCSWKITAPSGEKVFLSFNTFELESKSFCRHDYVELRNGANINSSLIGKYCGSSTPPPITTTGQTLYVRFRSDGNVTKKGFNASYRAVSVVNGNINGGFSTPWPVTSRRIRSSAPITVLPSTVLPSTVLPSAMLPSAVLSSVVLPSTVLPSVVLPSAVLPSAVLSSAVLPSTVLPSAVLPSVVLSSAVLPSTVLPSAVLPSVVLSSAVLPSTVLPSAVLPSVVLSSAVLPSTVLPSAVLPSVVLPSAVLSSVVLPSTVLPSVVLPSAVLPSTVLPSAVLPSVVLPSAELPSTVLPYRPTAGRYSSFVLRLPSSCNQLCVNTWGSFYCTCHPGYILSADGRTCVDEDECQNNNGGCSHKCNNVIGSHYCTCPEGQTMRSDNKSCNEPGINVVCSDRYLQISLEKRYFKDFDASRMHLEYKSCTPTTNSTHITFRTEFNDCGTRHNETEGKIRFMNTVKTDLLIIDGVVTRTQKVLLPFYCEYSKEKLMSVSFTTKTVVFASEGGYGNFSFKFNLYKTNLFVEPFRAADYPILVGLNQPIFLQYEIVSSNRSLVVFAENCRATPSANPYAVPQYVFLRRGCALDSTMSYNYILSPVQRFSINTFRFLLDHRAVFIHCELMACHSNTVISRCAQGCQRRRKRSDEPSFQNRESVSSRKYNLGFGPITLSKKEKAKAEKSSVTLAATVGTVGGALLIVIAILVVIILRKWVPNSLQSRSRETNISLNQRKEVSVLAFENQGNNIAENGI